MTDPHDLVCVYTANNAAKAELVRALLESEGIRAATGDTQNPFSGLSISPAEVFVERANEVAARSLIADAEQHRLDDSDELEDESWEEEATES